MIWFDTHSHIQSGEFRNDFPDMLMRARAAGVTRILLPGSNEPDSRIACRLAVDDPMLYAAVGVHPHDAKTWDEGSADRFAKLVRTTNDKALKIGRDRCVVAYGEIGLDFYRDLSPRKVQRTEF